jgi:hypothetical protein
VRAGIQLQPNKSPVLIKVIVHNALAEN